jgi:hypothetical protein
MARGRFYFSVTSSNRFLVPGPQNFSKDVLQLRVAREQPTNPFSLPFPWPFLTHQQQIPQHIRIIIQGNIRITNQSKWPQNERMGDITKHQLPLRRCDSRTERGKREIPRKHKWWEHRTLKEMLPCPGGQTKWAKLPWSWQKVQRSWFKQKLRIICWWGNERRQKASRNFSKPSTCLIEQKKDILEPEKARTNENEKRASFLTKEKSSGTSRAKSNSCNLICGHIVL